MFMMVQGEFHNHALDETKLSRGFQLVGAVCEAVCFMVVLPSRIWATT